MELINQTKVRYGMKTALKLAKGDLLFTKDIINIEAVTFCLKRLKTNCDIVLKQINPN